MVAMEKGQYYLSGPVEGLNKPVREFPCKTPAEVREELPSGTVLLYEGERGAEPVRAPPVRVHNDAVREFSRMSATATDAAGSVKREEKR